MGLRYTETYIHDIKKIRGEWQVLVCRLGGMGVGALWFTIDEDNLNHKICKGCIQGKTDVKRIRETIKKLKKEMQKKTKLRHDFVEDDISAREYVENKAKEHDMVCIPREMFHQLMIDLDEHAKKMKANGEYSERKLKEIREIVRRQNL